MLAGTSGEAAAARRVPDAERSASARGRRDARSAGPRRRCSARRASARWKASTSPPSTSCCASRSRASSPARSSRTRWPGKKPGYTPREVLRKLGDAGLLGLMYDERIRRRRGRCAHQPGLRRGAVAVDLRRLHHHRAGAHRHGEPAPAPRRHARRRRRRYMPGVTAGDDDHRGRRSPSRAPAPTSPASAPRPSARPTAASGSSTAPSSSSPTACTPTCTSSPPRPARAGTRCRCSSSRRARRAFAVGRALDKSGWLSSDTAELVFEDCRIPAGQPARRGEPRLLLGDEELPDRAHRPRRDGGRPLHAGAAADARARARAPGLRRDAVRQAGRCASAWRCSTPRCARRAPSCTTAPGG